MAPKKNQPAKDKGDKDDDATPSFAEGEITIDDLANIDKDFENALPYVDTFAVPPALNGLSNTGAVDYISYGHLRVEIADPEVKTAHGGDINMLYVYRVTLITDKDTGLPYIFSFPSDEFVAPPPAFDFRSPKLQDCNMVAQSYKPQTGGKAHMVKANSPEIYNNNKGIRLTSDKMYIGLSPEVCRYMSMKLNEAGHTVVGDTSMHNYW
eukprot:jgi/Tetstr1/462285/TSEL_007303.t1